MSNSYTFQQLRDFLKKDEPGSIELVDSLLGGAIICASAIGGPEVATVLLGMLGAKNELTKLGARLFTAVRGKKDADFLQHQERLRAAYALISVTSFFDALDRTLPDPLRQLLKSTDRLAIAQANASPQRPNNSGRPATSIGSPAILLPHPIQSFEDVQASLKPVYAHMSKGFLGYIQKLAVWDDLDAKQRKQLEETVDRIQETALAIFRAQYVELATEFSEFAVWANLHEHEQTRSCLTRMSEYVRLQSEISSEASANIDIGFSRLADLVRQIPQLHDSERAADVVEALRRHYEALTTEPIIDDKFESTQDQHQLAFPPVRQAFIPQAYRVLRQSSQPRRLESESTWSGISPRNDLGPFFLSYLSSPYSLETPLLVLGHPGSGKSLLTKVLSASLLSDSYTPIRVVLRDVDADASVPNQIEQYINSITADKIESWARFSKQFKNHPPVIILDGYDELLQASGKVFSNYLKDVTTFMNGEAVQGRPLRVIVTSRLTLIDKAAVPDGATILRLLEFDEARRNAWISVWNTCNASYFAHSDPPIQPFALPSPGDPGPKSILSLAEQPLLLLMLALYDSEGNRLRNSGELDRTALYDSLLRQFIKRERRKRREFLQLAEDRQVSVVDQDMQRLGVTAIGMHNRRKLHIQSPELEDDLRYFELGRATHVEHGRALSQADLLLGSFFFVHRSKARQFGDAPERHDESSAFEFLHNTFSEYLCAEFIVRQALIEVKTLLDLDASASLSAVRSARLTRCEGVPKAWFACMIYTPLFSRPVVLEMIREWSRHAIKRSGLGQDDMLAVLDEVVVSHIRAVLSDRNVPQSISGGGDLHFPNLPMLGHLAIYTINLVTLRTVIGGGKFVLDENVMGVSEDGARAWDRLTFLWRSWFSIDNLNGLSRVFWAARARTEGSGETKSQIEVTPEPVIRAASDGDRLNAITNVGIALGDNLLAGLAALAGYGVATDNRLTLEGIESRLEAEGVDVRLQVWFKRILALLISPNQYDPRRANDIMVHILRRSMEVGRVEELILCELLLRSWYPLSSEVYRESAHPRFLEEFAHHRPETLAIAFRALSILGGEDQYPWFGMGRSPHFPEMVLEMASRSPEIGLQILLYLWPFGRLRPNEHWEEVAVRLIERPDALSLMRRNAEFSVLLMTLVCSLPRRNGALSHKLEEMIREFESPDSVVHISGVRPELLLDLANSMTRFPQRAAVVNAVSRIAGFMHEPRVFMHLAKSRPRALARLFASFARPDFRRSGADLIRSTWHPHLLLDLINVQPEVAAGFLQLLSTVASSDESQRMSQEFGKLWSERGPRRLGWLINEHATTAAELLQFLMRAPDSSVMARLMEELPKDRNLGSFRNLIERSPLSLLERLMEWATVVDNEPLVSGIEKRVRELLRRRGRAPQDEPGD